VHSYKHVNSHQQTSVILDLSGCSFFSQELWVNQCGSRSIAVCEDRLCLYRWGCLTRNEYSGHTVMRYSCHVTSSAWKDFYCLYVSSVECVTACGIWDKDAEWAGPVLPEIDMWLSICTQYYILRYTRTLKYVSDKLIKIHVVRSESQLCLPWKALLATERAVALHAFAKLRKATFDMIYLLTAIELPPGGSSTVHICTQKIHRTTQRIWIPRTEHTQQ